MNRHYLPPSDRGVDGDALYGRRPVRPLTEIEQAQMDINRLSRMVLHPSATELTHSQLLEAIRRHQRCLPSQLAGEAT